MSTHANAWTLHRSKLLQVHLTYLKGVTGGDAKICLKDQVGGIQSKCLS